MRAETSIGIILVVVGLVMLPANLGVGHGVLALLVLSAGLFGVYFRQGANRRYSNVGLAIPARVILMIAIRRSGWYASPTPGGARVAAGAVNGRPAKTAGEGE